MWWTAAAVLGLWVAYDVVRVSHPSSGGCRAADSRALMTEVRARTYRLFARGEVGEAIAVATEAAGTAPEEPRAWALLGEMHAVAGHPRAARASYAACRNRATTRDANVCSARPE